MLQCLSEVLQEMQQSVCLSKAPVFHLQYVRTRLTAWAHCISQLSFVGI